MYLDWSDCPVVESDPERRSGAWVYKDTRTPVSLVFENLAAGASIDEIVEWFALSREQVIEVLMFAGAMLEAPAMRESEAMADAYSVR